MTEADIDAHAKRIWNYLQLHQPPQKCEALLVLCSLDIRVAEYAAQLYREGYADYVIFSGNGKGRLTEKLFTKTEAETFADIAMAAGVPEHHIILEKESTNSGENIRFTYELLKRKGLRPASVLIVQKPHMERRAYATFKKQWPDIVARIYVTSPRISYENYFNHVNTRRLTIESMLGDLQRIKYYPLLGYQIAQDIPPDVWQSFEQLVAAGYSRRLMPKAEVEAALR